MARKILLVFSCSIFLSLLATAQSKNDSLSMYEPRKTSVFLNAGGTQYVGDLWEIGDNLDPGLTFGIGIRQRIAPMFSLRGDLTFYNIKGDDRNTTDIGRNNRNLSFKADNFEGAIMGVFHLFPDYSYYTRPGFNLYFFAGIGMTTMNAKGKYQGEWHKLRPIQTEGNSYPAFVRVIPMGSGLTYKLSEKLDFGFEVAYRVTDTDYLDDVSTTYRPLDQFSDPIHKELSDRRTTGRGNYSEIRGNPTNNDSYWFVNFKLEYFLPYSFTQKLSRKKSTEKFR
ncbi:DUF6089 family protein [Fulvivirgaceae bacterium LMO-SS25]